MVRFVQSVIGQSLFGQRAACGISLRVALLRLILFTLLPLALASALIALQLWGSQQAAAEDSLRNTATALGLAVDREIAGVRGQLEAVAGSRMIDQGRWDELHAFISTIASARAGAVVAIVDASGQLRVQSNFALGARLPNLWQIESKREDAEWQGQRLPVSSQGLTRRVIESEAPAVSDLYLSLVARHPVVAVAVPVIRDGRALYAVVYSFPTEALERFLGDTETTSLRMALIDRNDAVVAKSAAALDRIGSRAHLAEPPPGEGTWVLRRVASDGVPVVSTFAVSDVTGWRVRVSQPVADALAPAYRAVVSWLVLFALVLAAAVASAVVLSGRLASPLVQLARSAGSGARPVARATGIREIDVLNERLVHAADTEEQRRAERERRVAAEERERVAAASERRVREREEELQIALDAGSMGTWRVDAAGRVRSDARHRELWNLPPGAEDFDASEIRSRMHPDDAERLWISGAKAVRTPRFAVEFRVRDAEGGWRWLAGHGTTLLGPDGEFAGIVGVNFDVTERRRAEEALRQSEAQFRQITDNVNDVFWISDHPQRTLRYLSPAFERRWKLDRSRMLRDPAAYRELIHAEDRASVETAFLDGAEAGRFDVEYRLQCPDGERWIHDRCFPLRDADGRVYRMVGIAQDITERKRNEADLAQLAFVVESVDDGIVSMDLDGRVRTWNPAAERMYGVAAAQAVGRPLHEVVDPDSGRLPELLAQVKRGETVRDVEERHGRDDGAWLNVALSLALIMVGDEVRGIVATIRDVTARRLYEQKLRQHMAELEEADRRKDHFLAMLGHELRNPLSPILNSARLMKLGGSDPGLVQRSAAVVERQVEHLTRLIDDLLDVARITEGKIVLKRERVDLVPLLYQALESTRPLVEARRQHLFIEPPSVPAFLDADPARIVQVFSNLLTNAAKYTPDGGQIRVVAERQGDRIAIRVSDDGYGIAPEILPQLFVPFAQAPEARDRAQGGLGIGLALVRRLVELHGGTVGARSDGPGRGSEFTVVLPLAADVAEPAEPRPTAGGAAGAMALTCLVVDDNADAADSLAALLQAAGHRTRVCYDAAAALKSVEHGMPELAILDIGLPGMDGYELARRIRKRDGGARVCLAALTGYGQPSDAERAKAAGFDLHLVKPLLPDALQALVARVAAQARATG